MDDVKKRSGSRSASPRRSRADDDMQESRSHSKSSKYREHKEGHRAMKNYSRSRSHSVTRSRKSYRSSKYEGRRGGSRSRSRSPYRGRASRSRSRSYSRSRYSRDRNMYTRSHSRSPMSLERIILSTGGPLEESDEETVIDVPIADTAEQVYISSLALMKMLKHGRAGVPLEVMGLLLGEFIDDYTVRVVDVFAMPQTGTGVSVEAVDPVFQAEMLQMLKQTGRPEMVVGWYHSHPGFGCWLSNIDISTQQSFEALSKRAIAVVIDPIQSVKGKVVIDAFRLINPDIILMRQESRQVTSNLGHLQKACKKAVVHGLNLHYYSICITYRKNELEQKMLLNLHKKTWMDGLTLTKYSEQSKINDDTVQEMLELMKNYKKSLEDEEMLTPEHLAIRHIGSQDPKRHLEQKVDTLMSSNIVQYLGAMLDTVVFK